MSELDSHRLHQAVWDELDPASGEHHLGAGVVPMAGAVEPWGPTDRKPMGARLAPVLGIAATLILLFTAGAYVFSSMGGGDDDSADSRSSLEMVEGGGDGGGGDTDAATDDSAEISNSPEADAGRTVAVRWDRRAGHVSADSFRVIAEETLAYSADSTNTAKGVNYLEVSPATPMRSSRPWRLNRVRGTSRCRIVVPGRSRTSPHRATRPTGPSLLTSNAKCSSLDS